MEIIRVLVENKHQWSWFYDTVKSVLPTLVTGCVAWLAMNKTHKQHVDNTNRLSEEFKVGVQLQLSNLRLNAQIATEIELKKELCKEIRSSVVKYIDLAKCAQLNRFIYDNNCKELEKISPSNRTDQLVQINAKYANDYNNASQQLHSMYINIMTYLDEKNKLEGDDILIKGVDRVMQVAIKGNSAKGMVSAINFCSFACRNLIKLKHKQIADLSIF